MRTILAITRKELEQYFASPIAYIVIAFFMLLCGIFFYIYLNFYVQQSMQSQMQGAPGGGEVSQSIMRPFVANVSFFLLLILPILTMRLFAEEKKQGTYELLMTSPLTIPQIVLGKYLGVISILLVTLLILAIYPALLFFFNHPDAGPILTGFLGLLLIGAAFLSAGLFFSSVTENQIVAAVMAFVFLLILWIINWVSRSEAWYGQLFQYVSIYQRFDDFTQGVLNLKDVFFYLSFVFFSLFVTGIVLQSQRWKA